LFLFDPHSFNFILFSFVCLFGGRDYLINIKMMSSLGSHFKFIGCLFDIFVDTMDADAADRFVRVGTLTLVLCVLSFGLGSSLVIVTQIAGLAHSDGVVQLLGMSTVPGHLVSTKLSVTGRAHVFGVMLSVNVWARSDLHGV
jgi:hypothetical protein